MIHNNRTENELHEKIICKKCELFNVNSIRHTKNIEELKCKSCERILISYSNHHNNPLKKQEDDSVFELPTNSKYIHLNNEILYDIGNTSIYNDKTVLVIGSGNIKRTNILINLRKLDFKKLITVNRVKNWSAEYFDDVIIAEHENINSKEMTLQIIRDYMKENHIRKFDAVLTYDDWCTLMASYLAHELGCLGIPFEVAKNIKNKYEFRNYCKKLGIVYPNYVLVKSNERYKHIVELEFLFEEIKIELDNKISKYKTFKSLTNLVLPVIVKNPSGSGKDFIRKCNSIEDYYQCLLDSIDKFTDNFDLIIEEFYDGHEIDLDILVANNKTIFIGISDNFPSEEPNFYEKGGITPSIELDSSEKQTIENIISDWITRLNLQNACLHFEARCRPKRLYANNNNQFENVDEFIMPIEINLRLGGAEAWSMNNAAYDVDLFHSYIHLKLGLEVNEELLKFKQINPRYTCISYDYHPLIYGEIKGIYLNIDNIINSSNIIEIVIFRTVGEIILPNDYIGWISVKTKVNSSYEELIEIRSKLMTYINFKINSF